MIGNILKKLQNISDLKANEHTIMAVLGVIVGLAGGFGAVGFRYLITFFQTLAYGSPDELLHVVSDLPWYHILWIPALGGLIVGDYGKGAFIYTGISFFRHIPYGVPGSYKLFLNILSYKSTK